jgi:hypothetical protein
VIIVLNLHPCCLGDIGRYGIPDTVRAATWPHLLGVEASGESLSQLSFQEYVALFQKSNNEVLKKIRVGIER